MQKYTNLRCWIAADRAAHRIHRLCKSFPQEARFEIAPQLRRAALSVPTNLVEGCGRDGDREFARLVRIAIGSAMEVDYLLRFCSEEGLVSGSDHREVTGILQDALKMMYGLLCRLKGSARRRPSKA